MNSGRTQRRGLVVVCPFCVQATLVVFWAQRFLCDPFCQIAVVAWVVLHRDSFVYGGCVPLKPRAYTKEEGQQAEGWQEAERRAVERRATERTAVERRAVERRAAEEVRRSLAGAAVLDSPMRVAAS